jgi:uncharacterized protein YeaO (DUF488 family)
MTSKLDVRMRRVYDDPSLADGTRVLVDRVWPRGLAKATARIDEWAKGGGSIHRTAALVRT